MAAPSSSGLTCTAVAGSRPVVSIGMPAYNGERYLRQALDSLLAQDYGNFELIISDNASTDTTPEICRAYAMRDRRIRYSRTDPHQIPSSNFDRVRQLATGDFFMWAATDDVWEPTFVSTLLGRLAEAPEAIIAFSTFNNVNEDGRETRTYNHLSELSSPDCFWRLRNFIVQDESLGKANLIYGLTRRSWLQAAGGFRVWGRRPWGADMLVVFRLLTFGSLVLANDVLFHKRLVADPPSVLGQERASVLALARGHWEALLDWLGYFSGLAYLIAIDAHLTAAEKMRLRAAVVGRVLKVGAGSLGRHLFPAAAR